MTKVKTTISLAEASVDLRRGIDHIGVACVFFCHDGKGRLLMHKRSTACRDEHGCWDAGGGAIEFGESFEAAVHREVMEEYAVEPQEIQLLDVYDAFRENNGVQTHWVSVAFTVKVDPAQVQIGEPEKMDDLQWFTYDTLPSPVHTMFPRNIPILRKKGII